MSRTLANGDIVTIADMYGADRLSSPNDIAVRSGDVAAGGGLSGERNFTAQLGGADGMCIDVAGNLFVTTSSGVQVFDVTARTGLYRVQMVVPGL